MHTLVQLLCAACHDGSKPSPLYGRQFGCGIYIGGGGGGKAHASPPEPWPPGKSVRPQPRTSKASPVNTALAASPRSTKLRQPGVWPGQSGLKCALGLRHAQPTVSMVCPASAFSALVSQSACWPPNRCWLRRADHKKHIRASKPGA